MKFEGQITANLPAIDLACTASFYQSLGFDLVYQSAEWMILRLGEMTLEFGGVSKSMLKQSRLNFDKIEKCE